jgi:hypothetical protein
VADAFLAAEHRDQLTVRIELDAEAVTVEARRRGPELLGAMVRRVLVGPWVARRFGQRIDDRRRRGKVGVADTEADDVDAGLLGLGYLPLQLGEEIGRDCV